VPGRALVLVVAVLLFVGACSDARKNALAQITPAEAKELRIVAAQLYKEYRATPAPEYLPLKAKVWPARFKKYKPLRVGLYADGAVLVLEGDAETEQGIHIVPITMDLAPSRGRVTYERIQDGVFWYRLGK
jgi:hypothetical protein